MPRPDYEDDYDDYDDYDDEPRPKRRRSRKDIPNYLVQAILVTLFCCLPLGIVSIVFAAQVNGKLDSGDIRGAQDASDKAKMFAWISFALGLIIGIPWIILNVWMGMNAPPGRF